MPQSDVEEWHVSNELRRVQSTDPIISHVDLQFPFPSHFTHNVHYQSPLPVVGKGDRGLGAKTDPQHLLTPEICRHHSSPPKSHP